VPWVNGTAPLEGKEEAYNCTNQEKCAEKVNLCDLFVRGEFVIFTLGILEEEKDDSDGTAAGREIDPG
jgi:hypothetical protein